MWSLANNYDKKCIVRKVFIVSDSLAPRLSFYYDDLTWRKYKILCEERLRLTYLYIFTVFFDEGRLGVELSSVL